MHPEETQVSNNMETFMQEVNLKPQEFVEDDIDVEKIDNGDFSGSQPKELNGNGFHQNGHSDHVETDNRKVSEERDVVPESVASVGADVKSVLRLKGPRRNSTSSRSSSVSSAPSFQQQSPVALQMEVSLEEEDKDTMEPLIIEGNAEDLEVSKCVEDYEADAVTTDSETIPTENEEEGWPAFEPEEHAQKTKSSKQPKAIKAAKSPSKSRSATKVKTPRTKSLKLKGNKQSSKNISEKLSIEQDEDYSDSNSLVKDDLEGDNVISKSKSPSKRSKSKQDPHSVDETEADEKSDAEQAPRRSSRARHTPQKYNSALFDSHWDYQPYDERLNNSDATLGVSIRSVKGRRSMRKTRNISALNESLHNDSSPWENDFKVLTPCGGGLSVYDDAAVEDKTDNTPLKRKANDDDDDDDFTEEMERGQKKMCVENPDLNNSTSSQTSSFFSVITSPIFMLKNKLRGSSVSSSTPLRNAEKDIATITVTENDSAVDGGKETEEVASGVEVVEEKPTAQPAAPEGRSWCTVM